MWLAWGRTPRGMASPRPRIPFFAFSSSCKGVQYLLLEAAADEAFPSQGRAPIFHRPRPAAPALRPWRPNPPPAVGEKRVVLYFTSLGVVRKTFEDCRAVTSILRGLRVAVDERDLSMDRGFLDELRGILGRRRLPLPRVFIGGRYIGGAEEIRQLSDTGELRRYVEGAPPAEPGVCAICGGFRFVLCEGCSGSHKCYSEKGGFRSCALCNENGLEVPRLQLPPGPHLTSCTSAEDAGFCTKRINQNQSGQLKMKEMGATSPVLDLLHCSSR